MHSCTSVSTFSLLNRYTEGKSEQILGRYLTNKDASNVSSRMSTKQYSEGSYFDK